MKIKFNIFMYLILPFMMREVYLALFIPKSFRLKLNISILLFVIISFFLVIKSQTSGSILGLYMMSKFSFLLLGKMFGENDLVFKDSKNITYKFNFLLLLALIASILTLLGFDYWSGSGAYSTRPPAFFRGFGELGIFLAIAVGFGGSVILVLVVGFLSLSKTVYVGVFIALIMRYPFKISMGLMFLLMVFYTFPIASLGYGGSNDFLKQFMVSIIGFNDQSAGYMNRYNGSMDLMKMTMEHYSVFFIGGNDEKIFDVWPEYGAGYLFKIGGFFLLVLTVLFVWSAIGLSRITVPIYAILFGSAYSLSPIAFFMYGYFGVIIKRNQKKIPNQNHPLKPDDK